MPVTSPRRSSILASGGSDFTTSTTPQSSITSGALQDRTSTYKSYLDRANLSKYSTTSTSLSSSASATPRAATVYQYNPNSLSNYYGSNSSTYSTYNPRSYSTYRSLSGGSSGLLGTCRNTTTTNSSLLNYDTNSSGRCGFNDKRINATGTKSIKILDDWDNCSNSHCSHSNHNVNNNDLLSGTKKPSDNEDNQMKMKIKRPPGPLCSTAALARYVATSALDIYEKYSPANYKPNTDLSGCRSSALNGDDNSNNGRLNTATDITDISNTFERCNNNNNNNNNRKSLYSRWYNQQHNDEVDNVTCTSTTSATVTATVYPRIRTNSRTRSTGPMVIRDNDHHHDERNVDEISTTTTATIKLRSIRQNKSNRNSNDNNDDDNINKNNDDHNINDANAAAIVTQKELNKLKIGTENRSSSPIAASSNIFNSSIDDTEWTNYRLGPYGNNRNDNNTINPNSNGDDLKEKITGITTKRPSLTSKSTVCSSKVTATPISIQLLKNDMQHSGNGIQSSAATRTATATKTAVARSATGKIGPNKSIKVEKQREIASPFCSGNGIPSKTGPRSISPIPLPSSIATKAFGKTKPTAGTYLSTTTATTKPTSKSIFKQQQQQLHNSVKTSNSGRIVNNESDTITNNNESLLNCPTKKSTQSPQQRLNQEVQQQKEPRRDQLKISNNCNNNKTRERGGANDENNNNINKIISSDINNIKSNSNSNSNSNNNMQTTSFDHDDIKFIDSDEQYLVTNATAERQCLTGSGTVDDCPAIYDTSTSRPDYIHNYMMKNFMRPKSTIVCTAGTSTTLESQGPTPIISADTGRVTATTATVSSATVRDSTNLNKFGGNICGNVKGTTLTESPVLLKTDKRYQNHQKDAATTGHHQATHRTIDTNSIQASIEKFNSISEQKRLPSHAALPYRSCGSGSNRTGSTNNTMNLNNVQPHQRYTNSFDNYNLRSSTTRNDSGSSSSIRSSGSGSGHINVTNSVGSRSPLRSYYNTNNNNKLNNSNHNHNINNVMASKVATASMPKTPSTTTTTTAAKVSNALTNIGNTTSISSRYMNNINTGSLPLKSTARHFIQQNANLNLNGNGNDNDNDSDHQNHHNNHYQYYHKLSGLSSSVDSDICNKKMTSIINDSSDALITTNNKDSLRSTLSSKSTPTSSRYWDRERDSNRSSVLNNSNLITGYNNHNIDDGKKSTKNEETEGLCGLRNIGNTCFMNSVIQCLSHTKELTTFLRNYNAARSSTSKDQQILYEFSKLIKEMWSSNVNYVTPAELKRAFSAKHRMYSDYNQQDAQEFLRFFLDSLHSALNTGIKGERLRIDDNLSDNKKADLTWEWYCRHESSVIRDLFVGQLKSTLRCTTCGNASVTFDPFWDLSVPLPSSSRCKLEACLDLFIREEVLDGDEMPTCSKCQTRRKCTKSFTIQRFPKYLVIHLKRFSETRWSKLSNIVEFPTGVRSLNMAPYAANANSNITYSLYGISNHMGSTAGGHYVAICKHPVSEKWHEFNDNIVSDNLSEHHLVSSSAYILFYERA